MLLNKIFPIVDTCLHCEDSARQSCTMVPKMAIFCVILRSVFPASRVQHISDLHSKFSSYIHFTGLELMNASNRSSCYLHTKFSHTLKPPVLRICITSSLCNRLAALILHPLLPSLSHQHHHGLRGSDSPVLTATGLVNGK